MGTNGEMVLARALTALAKDHVQTQLSVQGSMLTTTYGYIENVGKSTDVLDYDQKKCAHYSERATTNNELDAQKAAYWHAKYQVDSAVLNKEMGTESGTVNTEEVMEHTQAQNLNPVYSVLEYVALIFVTTSGLINK